MGAPINASLFNIEDPKWSNFLYWEKNAIQFACVLEFYWNTLLHTLDPDNNLLFQYYEKWSDQYAVNFNSIWEQWIYTKREIKKLLYKH